MRSTTTRASTKMPLLRRTETRTARTTRKRRALSCIAPRLFLLFHVDDQQSTRKRRRPSAMGHQQRHGRTIGSGGPHPNSIIRTPHSSKAGGASSSSSLSSSSSSSSSAEPATMTIGGFSHFSDAGGSSANFVDSGGKQHRSASRTGGGGGGAGRGAAGRDGVVCGAAALRNAITPTSPAYARDRSTAARPSARSEQQLLAPHVPRPPFACQIAREVTLVLSSTRPRRSRFCGQEGAHGGRRDRID